MFRERDLRTEIESASVHLSRMKREALKILVPESKDLESQIVLITELTGRPPNLYDLYPAEVEWHLLNALEGGEKIDWKGLDPTMYLQTRAPSLKGKRSGQIVEIAKAEHTEIKQSLFDRIRNRS